MRFGHRINGFRHPPATLVRPSAPPLSCTVSGRVRVMSVWIPPEVHRGPWTRVKISCVFSGGRRPDNKFLIYFTAHIAAPLPLVRFRPEEE